MSVHLMQEPWFGILVTGCDDIERAKELAVAEYGQEIADQAGHWGPGDDPDRWEQGEPDAWFDTHPGKIETGRIIPAQPDEDVSWWWRAGYTPGKRGVTTAVLFDRPRPDYVAAHPEVESAPRSLLDARSVDDALAMYRAESGSPEVGK